MIEMINGFYTADSNTTDSEMMSAQIDSLYRSDPMKTVQIMELQSRLSKYKRALIFNALVIDVFIVLLIVRNFT